MCAFKTYLTQKHCAETLEFTSDAEQYRRSYTKANDKVLARDQERSSCICLLWEKLMQEYIIPEAPREINLPCQVRDQLLDLPFSSPPNPSSLDEAVRTVYELINDSVLVDFIDSRAPDLRSA